MRMMMIVFVTTRHECTVWLVEGRALFLSSAQSKLEGTVWTDVDDSRVFKVLDLEDIEKTFSAYQRQQVLRALQLIGRREAGAKR